MSLARASPAEVHDTVEMHSKMFRDLMLGFVRVHLPHHANEGEIYGSGRRRARPGLGSQQPDAIDLAEGGRVRP